MSLQRLGYSVVYAVEIAFDECILALHWLVITVLPLQPRELLEYCLEAFDGRGQIVRLSKYSIAVFVNADVPRPGCSDFPNCTAHLAGRRLDGAIWIFSNDRHGAEFVF